MASRLNGKTIVITGASSGIGADSAREFAKAANCKLVLTARRVDRLDALKKEIEGGTGTKVHTLELDVCDRDAVIKAFSTLPEEFSKIDVLVCNAGVALGMDPVENVKPQDVDLMLNTNIKGLLWCCQACLPGMKERGSGHIINLGSISSSGTYPGGSIYCGTKFFVRALTRSLRQETLNTPIRVSEVDPGMVETEFSVVRWQGDKSKADSTYANLTSNPLYGQDIGELLVFIASRPDHVVIAETLILPSCQTQGVAMISKKT